MQPFADVEIARVVDGSLGSQGATFFVVLLDAGPFVIDMQRGYYPVGDDAGAKGTLGRYPPGTYLVRRTTVDFLAFKSLLLSGKHLFWLIQLHIE